MHYIGLDVHKKTISCCVKDAVGHVHREGKVGSTRRETGMPGSKTLPQPRTIAMEATIFRWVDLRSSTSACGTGEGSSSADATGHCPRRRRRTTESMPARLPTVCAVISCPNATWLPPRSATDAGCGYRNLVVKQMNLQMKNLMETGVSYNKRRLPTR